MRILVNGEIISNDYKWLYDWFELESTCPQAAESSIESGFITQSATKKIVQFLLSFFAVIL